MSRCIRFAAVLFVNSTVIFLGEVLKTVACVGVVMYEVRYLIQCAVCVWTSLLLFLLYHIFSLSFVFLGESGVVVGRPVLRIAPVCAWRRNVAAQNVGSFYPLRRAEQPAVSCPVQLVTCHLSGTCFCTSCAVTSPACATGLCLFAYVVCRSSISSRC